MRASTAPPEVSPDRLPASVPDLPSYTEQVLDHWLSISPDRDWGNPRLDHSVQEDLPELESRLVDRDEPLPQLGPGAPPVPEPVPGTPDAWFSSGQGSRPHGSFVAGEGPVPCGPDGGHLPLAQDLGISAALGRAGIVMQGPQAFRSVPAHSAARTGIAISSTDPSYQPVVIGPADPPRSAAAPAFPVSGARVEASRATLLAATIFDAARNSGIRLAAPDSRPSADPSLPSESPPVCDPQPGAAIRASLADMAGRENASPAAYLCAELRAVTTALSARAMERHDPFGLEEGSFDRAQAVDSFPSGTRADIVAVAGGIAARRVLDRFDLSELDSPPSDGLIRGLERASQRIADVDFTTSHRIAGSRAEGPPSAGSPDRPEDGRARERFPEPDVSSAESSYHRPSSTVASEAVLTIADAVERIVVESRPLPCERSAPGRPLGPDLRQLRPDADHGRNFGAEIARARQTAEHSMRYGWSRDRGPLPPSAEHAPEPPGASHTPDLPPSSERPLPDRPAPGPDRSGQRRAPSREHPDTVREPSR